MENLETIYIHDGHTKCNIIDIITNSNIDILQPYLYSKEKLLNTLSIFLKECNYELNFYGNHPFSNKEEFILYLGENPSKISGADKRRITDTAKQIIQFCKSGYDFNKSVYNNLDDIYTDCLKIKEYGDIFCVRTAINLFNIVLECEGQELLILKMSKYTHNKLQLKNTYKKKCIPSLQIKKGKFIIDLGSNNNDTTLNEFMPKLQNDKPVDDYENKKPKIILKNQLVKKPE
jgi:hypothetical protein